MVLAYYLIVKSSIGEVSEVGRQKKVLLVDDERAFLLGFRKAVEGPDMRIFTAETVEDAFALLKKRDYDVVISDIRLTGVVPEEGLEILGHVKEHKPGTKVIIITGYGSSYIREKAYAMGADLYFEKPVHTCVLKEAVKKL
jgi:two-component system response regulator RegA